MTLEEAVNRGVERVCFGRQDQINYVRLDVDSVQIFNRDTQKLLGKPTPVVISNSDFDRMWNDAASWEEYTGPLDERDE